MADSEFIQFLLDQPAPISDLYVKKMFGEYCLFYGDKIVAIIRKDHQIFVKANHDTLPLFLAEHATQFSYEAKGKTQKMHYWRIPDEAIEEADELIKWLRLGLLAI